MNIHQSIATFTAQLMLFASFSIPMLLSYVSSVMKLEVGDVVLTGTPKGVGPIKAGDVITAGLKPGSADKDLMRVTFNVADRKGLFKA